MRTEIRRPTRHKFGIIILLDGQGLHMSECAATFTKAYDGFITALERSGVAEYDLRQSAMQVTESATIIKDGEPVSLFESQQTAVRWDFTVNVYGEFHAENAEGGEWYGAEH